MREAPYKEKKSRKISLQTFLAKYRKGAPGVKYEFNNGIIEKTEAMKLKENFIIQNLRRRFTDLPAYKNGGSMECELEVWTSPTQWRKPGMAYITLEQTKAAADGAEPMPEFIIEVISKNDEVNVVKGKVYEYFKAGVKILWHIFPDFGRVEIYRSPDDIEVCSGEKICSAEPVVDGFRIPAANIFKKP